jgi:hypothetical protein
MSAWRKAMAASLVLGSLLGGGLVSAAPFPVNFGTSWDGISLQDVLDAEYGVGVIDALTDYEGYLAGDADPAYWEDLGLDGILIREIAGYRNGNSLGWYAESLGSPPVIDGDMDGVIFTGPMSPRQSAMISFPGGVIRFGFYLDPNGAGTELFFTNRFYNDAGADGPGTGDPQCLIYNISRLRNGVPTFVLAWEDLDAGQPLAPTYEPGTTDNDYQDMVIEITAFSPVRVESESWGAVKSLYQD